MRMKFLTLMVAALLSACGGGGGSDNSNNGGTKSTYTPSAAVLAAKSTNYATPFYASTGTGSGCGNVSNTTVYLLPNTITYAASGVSEASQQQAAEYAEQAMGEIKATLGLSSGTGYTGQRIQVCAQSNLVLGSATGMGEKDGLIVTSSDSSNLDAGYLPNGFDLYKKLVKQELVHVYHQSLFGTNAAVLDTWFAEGFAEYIASGKSTKTKAEIMALVNAQNPIAVMASGLSSGNLQYYPAFQSSVAYLFDTNGAKNNLSMAPTFLNALKTNYTSASTSCAAAGTCATFRQDAFAQTFEANFKEADGTAMKLRTGTNNLQDTIATRLTNFLQ
jgi:uncharacterized protein YceK